MGLFVNRFLVESTGRQPAGATIASMLTKLLDLIKRILGRFSLRDLGHFGAAFVGALAVSLQTTTLPTTKAAWIALGAGALSVAFRQAFPNANISAAQLESYVTRGEKILAGLKANPVQVVTSPSNADIVSALVKLVGPQITTVTQTGGLVGNGPSGATPLQAAPPAVLEATAALVTPALADVPPGSNAPTA